MSPARIQTQTLVLQSVSAVKGYEKKTKKEQMPIDNLIFTFIIWMHSFVTSNLPKGPAGK